MRRAFLIGLLVMRIYGPALVHAGLEVPSDGPNLSGLGDIHGWLCDAGNLTFTIDNGPPGQLVYGANRNDTIGPCGDANNGFIQQFNWNLLPTGQHTIRLFNNGQQFGQATFTVVNIGTEFLTGASALCATTLAGQNVLLSWQQNQQNFAIVGRGEGLNVSGTYATSLDFVDENCNFLSVPPDLPTHANPTLSIIQIGNQLSVVSGSITLTGTLEADGDFAVVAPSSQATVLSCTYALVLAYGGNFFDHSLVLVVGAAFVSGNCSGITIPCAVLYAGSFNQINAISDGTGAGVEQMLGKIHEAIQKQ